MRSNHEKTQTTKGNGDGKSGSRVSEIEVGEHGLSVQTERHASTSLSCLGDVCLAREKRRGRMTPRKSITWTENAMVFGLEYPPPPPATLVHRENRVFIVIVTLSLDYFDFIRMNPVKNPRRYRIHGSRMQLSISVSLSLPVAFA